MRMMIVMVINLFAIRIILKALGTVDYGVYNVVAGVITMLSCVTTVLMTATQRFYSYSIGEGDREKLRKIYSVSVNFCVIGVIAIIIIGETVGLWFVNNHLNIPVNRMYAANWLYQMTIISFVFNFMQIPFGSSIIAHEKMGIFAAISTFETFLKFLAALSLIIVSIDRLITYGVLLALISLTSLIVYVYISINKFPECHYISVDDKHLFKELISFSGWNFLGALASVGMHYVNMILVNVFFGPVLNASQAIAFQISSALNTFAGSFILALRPPMIKLYAEKKYVELNRLFAISNKVVYYLMLMICVPLFLEMDTVLLMWLNVADETTVLFARLIIIYTIVLVLNNPISIIMQATGYVKQYFLPVESVTLLCPLITFLFFKMQFPVYFVFVAMLICVTCSHFIRVYILCKYYVSPVLKEYILFGFEAVLITACIIFVSISVKMKIGDDLNRLVSVTLVSVFTTLFLVYAFSLNRREKLSLNSYIKQFLHI